MFKLQNSALQSIVASRTTIFSDIEFNLHNSYTHIAPSSNIAIFRAKSLKWFSTKKFDIAQKNYFSLYEPPENFFEKRKYTFCPNETCETVSKRFSGQLEPKPDNRDDDAYFSMKTSKTEFFPAHFCTFVDFHFPYHPTRDKQSYTC